MKGSLQQDGRRGVVDGKPYWRLRVYAGQDPVTGKPRFRERGLRATKRAAEAELRKFAAEVDDGKHRSTDGTLGFLLDRWIAHGTPSWSPTTLNTYTSQVRKHIRPALGDVPLSKLGAAELDAFYTSLRAKGLAPASVRKNHNIIRRALVQAVRWGWINANPAALAEPPKVTQHEIVPPTGDQVDAVMALVSGLDADLAAFLAVSSGTGARRGEVCGLRAGDFDEEEATLLIARAVVPDGAGIVVKGTKTDRQRRIALDPGTAAALAVHIERIHKRAADAGVRMIPNPYLFGRRLDGSLPPKPGTISQAWKRRCARAGVAGVRLHDLRHRHVSVLLAAGVDVRTVAGRMGHSNPAVTLSVYSHFMRPADRAAATTWAEQEGRHRSGAADDTPGTPDSPDDPS